MKKIFIYQVLIFFLTLFIYLLVAGQFHWKFEKTNFAYFNLLSESFLKKSWSLVNPPANRYDLSVYQGRVYLYWGPLPAIVIMPLIAIWGNHVSDLFYTAFFGAFNVFLFSLLLSQLRKLIKNKLNNRELILLTLFFAFGTVNFAVSVVGRVWFTSQVISLTFHLLSLIFLLKFLSSQNLSFFIISISFLIITSAGKLTYFLMLPAYFYSLFYLKPSLKKIITVGTITSFILFIFFSLYGFYNYKRFNSPFQIGYRYQLEHPRFKALEEKYGRFNSHYLLTNIKYQLFNPLKLSKKFPFIRPDVMGNGFFATSPLFLLLFWKIKEFIKNRYAKIFLLAALPIFLQLMFFYGTGSDQFGARYLLDIIPLLILLLALQIKEAPNKLKYFICSLSIIFCSLGAVWFSVYHFG